jgi:type IV pilus assembly protein PilP
MKQANDMLKQIQRTLLVCVPMVLLGCAGGVDDQLHAYVDDVKARPGGRIEPLPQIKPYEKFAYAAEDIRTPFAPARPDASSARTGPKPNVDRNKEYLEQFPLDTLAMVGTLDREGETFGLLRTKDGMVHRVISGNYIGQNDGRVVVVNDAGIRLEELVPDGIGGFYKRSAEIGLDE